MAKEHHARLPRAAEARERVRGEASACHPIPCSSRPTLFPVTVLVLLFLIPILNSGVAFGAEFYVAPNGSSSGNGSIGSPWSLSRALSHPPAVRPGDTIWLRGGTYRGGFTSRLTGTAGLPITVRQYLGERATIDSSGYYDGPLIVFGAWTHFWDFEVMSSDPNRSRVNATAINAKGPNTKFINMIVHDAGFGLWAEGPDSEIYGCLIYYTGDTGLDHGIYNQNATGTQRIVDNIIFNNASHGIHSYGEALPSNLNNIHFEGNTSFQNGILGAGSAGRNLLVGGVNGVVARNPSVVSNYLYYANPSTDDSFVLGYGTGCTNPTITNNYAVGGTRLRNCTGVTMTGNTYYGPTVGFSQSGFPANTYLTQRPTGTRTFIRPNAYEPGRAHITIYNWDLQSTVPVSVGGILNAGDQYEVRTAQNYFGAPVTTGTYNGSPIPLPMTGLSAASPVGLARPAATGPEFNAFVLIRTAGGSPCDPTYGDVDQDGSVNAADLVILGNYLVGNLTQGSPPFTAPLGRADLDRSGSVDAADHLILQNYLAGNISCLPR